MASQKVNEVINLLKANQKVASIYVPSLKKEVKFRHLTAGQQERFVQAIVDNPGLQTRFILTLIDVIKESCEDKSVLNNFTIIDRYAIGLSLRAASVGETVKTEVESEPGIVYSIDLKQNLDYIKNKTAHPQFESITVDNLKIDLQYPTISQEQANEKYFKRDENSMEGSPEAIRNVISTAFIGDALMFIKTLTITKEEGDPVVLDFNLVTLQDKLELVRKLPNTIYEKLLDPMAVVKRQIESMLKAVGTSDADEKVKRTILISFDPSLFISST